MARGGGPWWTTELAASLGLLLGALLVVAYVNAFNFMDGVNGISGLNAVVAGAYLATLMTLEGQDTLAVVAAVVAGAAAGFLPWNVPRAKVFLGDAGSYGLGSAIAVLVVLGIAAGVDWLFGLAAVAVYAIDTGATLLRRAVAREPLFRAHRQHVYQQLTTNGWGHLGAAAAAAGASALACTWALTVDAAGWSAWWTLPGLAVVGVAYLALPVIAWSSPAGASRPRTSDQAGSLRQGGRSGA